MSSRKENIAGYLGMLGGIAGIHRSMASYIPPYERGILGHGIILKFFDEPNRDKYGQLYRNDIKLNDGIFRVGGISSGFNDKSYCNLIKYELKPDGTYDFGKHCIIDANGEIVLIETDHSNSTPHYIKGCIASMKEVYYNLRTRKPICRGSHSIESVQYLFVENKYDWNNRNEDASLNFPLGVYKIDYETGEVQLFQ